MIVTDEYVMSRGSHVLSRDITTSVIIGTAVRCRHRQDNDW